jgi:hypothetical protein
LFVILFFLYCWFIVCVGYVPELYQMPVHLFKSVRLSEKSFVYFLVLQAVGSMTDSIVSVGTSSATPWAVPYISVLLNAVPSLTFGALYLSNFARLQEFRLPTVFRSVASAINDRLGQLWTAAGTPSGAIGPAGASAPGGNYGAVLGGNGGFDGGFVPDAQNQRMPQEQASDEVLQAAIRASMGAAAAGGGGGAGGGIPASEDNIETLLALGLAELTREQARSVLERSFNDVERAANMLLSGEY